MSAWIRRGSVILLTMLLFLTAAVAENAQIPILIDGVRVAFFDADGNLLTPKAENGLLYVPLQAFCENMGLSAEVQGQSVAVDGTRIGMFDEAGQFPHARADGRRGLCAACALLQRARHSDCGGKRRLFRYPQKGGTARRRNKSADGEDCADAL